MIKVEIVETFGPFCGMGGYGSRVQVGLDHRSFKRAMTKAKAAPAIGSFGGGVPVLLTVRIYKSGKLLNETFS